MIALDSSFLVRALVLGTPEDRTLRGWLGRGEQLAVSAISWAEFLCGPLTVEQASLAAIVVSAQEPFVAHDATAAAALFNATGRRRRTFVDCMIAAAAMRRDQALATSNEPDFRPFVRHGLALARGATGRQP
mgnify:CR=1 FL=1